MTAALQSARRAMARVRAGLLVFRDPKLGGIATVAQLAAWALQWLSCYVLLVALGLNDQAGLAAAAAVLFAVNITAVVPATPANLGVFQAACATVLHAGWHVGIGTGVAYGVILQAVEITTAILMGAPSLLKEGMSWREVRLRAMHATPVKLPARPQRSAARAPPGPKRRSDAFDGPGLRSGPGRCVIAGAVVSSRAVVRAWAAVGAWAAVRAWAAVVAAVLGRPSVLAVVALGRPPHGTKFERQPERNRCVCHPAITESASTWRRWMVLGT